MCGPTERAPDDSLAVVNPVLVVEVTSPSTEDYDRDEKLRHYKSLPSVQEVLIASHREPPLTLHQRGGEGWVETTAGPGERVSLPSLSTELAVGEVYRGGLEDVR